MRGAKISIFAPLALAIFAVEPVQGHSAQPTLRETLASFAGSAGTTGVGLSALTGAPCVSPSDQKTFAAFLSQMETTKKTAQAKMQEYEAIVSRPMNGNGKCEGGFNGVARETKERAELSAQELKRTLEMRAQLEQELQAKIIDPKFVFDEDVGMAECGSQALEEYKLIQSWARKSLSDLQQVANRYELEQKRFSAYSGTNGNLASSCGELDKANAQRFPGGKGAGSAIPRMIAGHSEKEESTITGNIKDQHLSPGSKTVAGIVKPQSREAVILPASRAPKPSSTHRASRMTASRERSDTVPLRSFSSSLQPSAALLGSHENWSRESVKLALNDYVQVEAASAGVEERVNSEPTTANDLDQWRIASARASPSVEMESSPTSGRETQASEASPDEPSIFARVSARYRKSALNLERR